MDTNTLIQQIKEKKLGDACDTLKAILNQKKKKVVEELRKEV